MDITKKRIIKNILKAFDRHPLIKEHGKKLTAIQHLRTNRFELIKNMARFKVDYLLDVTEHLHTNTWEQCEVIMFCEYNGNYFKELKRNHIYKAGDIRLIRYCEQHFDTIPKSIRD